MQPQLQEEIQPQAEQQVEQKTEWNIGTRIAFRFAFAYLVLYNFPFPLYLIPYTQSIWNWNEDLYRRIVVWVASHVLHLSYPITVFTNGSGDTTYDWVRTLCFLTVAVTMTIVWSVLDRKRPNYETLHQWLRIGIRLALATAMISYGMNKVIKLQFPAPFLSRLMGTYGESTPMSLLWTFMGASKTYTIFAGAVEAVGGLLLLVPRLTLLGALVSMAAMGNVFLLNMSYDVPVKLYSFHLLLMSVFLVFPDLKRMAALFLFNRRVEPAPSRPLFQRRWLNYGLLGVQLLYGAWFFGTATYGDYQTAKLRGDDAPKPPLYGIWMVDEFSINGEARPALATDDQRWQRIIVDSRFEALVQSMNGSHQRFLQQVNVDKKTLTLRKREVPTWKAQFNFTNTAPEILTLEGQLDGQTIRTKLHHVPEPKFMLTTRGFHWINEYPFNRYNE